MSRKFYSRNLKYEREFRIQTEEVGSRKLVIGDAREKAMLVIRAAIEAHSEM